ncbi:MAG TPA: hypothetical protein VNJ03_01800 [Vicinamibacterales bacterium]|nr:hypothetical protein [Vicinamibacterales bacterium]
MGEAYTGRAPDIVRAMWMMMVVVVSALLAQVQQPPVSQAPPPDTEVFLARLTTDGGRLTVGDPKNISNSPGYDNQPSFSPNGASLYFTSARGEMSPGGRRQMDIYRFDVKSQRVVPVTRTPESEYSATVTPDGRHVSVIRVEGDGAQRLWKFTTEGQEPSLVLIDIKPVGYHAWLDANTLALFVLGEPATLQIADTRTGTAVVAAKDIGRSLQRMPGGGVSYVQRGGGADTRTLTIWRVSVEHGKPVTSPITEAAPGATDEFVAWTPDGALLMAAAGKLYAWRRGDTQWAVIADLDALGLKGVTRLAINPTGNLMALVAQGAASK